MEFTSDYKMQSDFQKIITPSNDYSIKKNDVTFYNNKFFDLSALTFLHFLDFEIYTSSFSSFNMYTNFQDDPIYGLY